MRISMTGVKCVICRVLVHLGETVISWDTDYGHPYPIFFLFRVRHDKKNCPEGKPSQHQFVASDWILEFAFKATQTTLILTYYVKCVIKTAGNYWVYKNEVWQVIWVWQIKICKLEFVWRWFWNSEAGKF